jgi:hypothetical protein
MEELDYFDRLEKSRDAALTFIKTSRNPDRLWSDFRTLAGESIFWVSGYIGYMISRYGGGQDEWLDEAAGLIRNHRNPDGGWGYGPGVPSDADSTSWCLRFLSSRGMPDGEICAAASRVILRHQNDDGGFRTYFSPSAIGRFMGLDGIVSFEGWLSSQLCVTGVAVESLTEAGYPQSISTSLDLIRRGQIAEGYWNSYWWSGNLYATVHCMEAMKPGATTDDLIRLKNAQDWIARTQLADGSWGDSAEPGGIPFWTALALDGLLLEPRPDLYQCIGNGIHWLLAHQASDGSWAPGYILRIPHPSMKEPWKYPSWKKDGRAINALIRDHRHLFSTATVISAFTRYLEQASKGKIL